MKQEQIQRHAEREQEEVEFVEPVIEDETELLEETERVLGVIAVALEENSIDIPMGGGPAPSMETETEEKCETCIGTCTCKKEL